MILRVQLVSEKGIVQNASLFLICKVCLDNITVQYAMFLSKICCAKNATENLRNPDYINFIHTNIDHLVLNKKPYLMIWFLNGNKSLNNSYLDQSIANKKPFNVILKFLKNKFESNGYAVQSG